MLLGEYVMSYGIVTKETVFGDEYDDEDQYKQCERARIIRRGAHAGKPESQHKKKRKKKSEARLIADERNSRITDFLEV
jgi:hypothetical protein